MAARCSLRIWQKKSRRLDKLQMSCSVWKSTEKPFIKKMISWTFDGQRRWGFVHRYLSSNGLHNQKQFSPFSFHTPMFSDSGQSLYGIRWNPNFKPLWNYFLAFLNNTKRVLIVKGVNRSIECRGFGCSSSGITTWQNVQYITKAVTFQISQVTK